MDHDLAQLGWIAVDTTCSEGLPQKRHDPYNHWDYSEPVICMINGKRYEILLAYSFRMSGWVQADLHLGPNPEDYRDIIPNPPTHFHYLPSPVASEASRAELAQLDEQIEQVRQKQLELFRKTTDKQATYIVDLEMLVSELGLHISKAPVKFEEQPELFPYADDPAVVKEWVSRAIMLHAQSINVIKAVDYGIGQSLDGVST